MNGKTHNMDVGVYGVRAGLGFRAYLLVAVGNE